MLDRWVEEEWRPIPGFPGYDVSSFGRVRSGLSGMLKLRKVRLNSWGRPQITMHRYGRLHCFEVHVLVARAFLGAPPAGTEVNHIDGNKRQNFFGNLEYITHLENVDHARRLGLLSRGPTHPARGERLTDAQVESLRADFRAGRASKPALAAQSGLSFGGIKKILAGRRR